MPDFIKGSFLRMRAFSRKTFAGNRRLERGGIIFKPFPHSASRPGSSKKSRLPEVPGQAAKQTNQNPYDHYNNYLFKGEFILAEVRPLSQIRKLHRSCCWGLSCSG